MTGAADGVPARAPLAGRVAGLLDRLAAMAPRVGPDRDTIAVTAPFTGELLGRVPRGTEAEVADAVGRARAAQPAWAARPVADRARIFLRYHDLVLDRQAELLDLIQLETGKSRTHAFEEIADIAIVARHYAHHGPRHLRPRRRKAVLPAVTATWEHHHPRGVVGFIAPWNYPFSLAVGDAIPALIAGNAAVVKPDAATPFTALLAVELLYEAGLPRDLVRVVTGEGAEVGPAFVRSVDYLCFTGSTATGRVVAREAAERLIGCSLELGGKNPMIVLADADLAAAAAGAVRGAFASAGQLCISVERIYVESAVHDAFVDRFVAATRALRLSASLAYDGDVGSLASARQLEKVEAHVRDAVERGATVLAGGRPRPDLGPFFYEPTILAGVTGAMRIFDEETFGPVVAVYRVDSADEAVERANTSRYGLNASIWTRDAGVGRALATRIRAGTVNVNEAYAATWGSVDAPMGGVRDSGLGRRHGAEGILKYTEAQTVSVQRWVPLAPPRGMGGGRFSGLVTAALRLVRRVPGLR